MTVGVVAGIVLGAVMAAVLGTINAVRHRGTTGSWSPRQHATITFTGPPQAAHTQIYAALQQLRARVTTATDTDVHAVTPITWRTRGARLHAHLRPAEPGTAPAAIVI